MKKPLAAAASFGSSSSLPFGPQLKNQAQPEMKKVKKLIHYDCGGDVDEDVPDEDEIYIKENLLNKRVNKIAE